MDVICEKIFVRYFIVGFGQSLRFVSKPTWEPAVTCS